MQVLFFASKCYFELAAYLDGFGWEMATTEPRESGNKIMITTDSFLEKPMKLL